MTDTTDTTADLLVERSDNVLWLTLNRPKSMNAMTPSMLEALGEALVGAREDDAVRVVVLTGAEDRSFCAGMDLSGAPEVTAAEDQFSPPPVHLAKGLDFNKPVIAAVNGYALGGGLELALACDLRIASENASFGLPEVGIGTMPGAGGTQRLPRAVPSAIAMKMLLLGERIDAAEALRVGLVSDVVEPGALLDLAAQFAAKIASNAPLAVRATKQAVEWGAAMQLDDAVRVERSLFNIVRDTADRQEGRVAFREKRKAAFEGR